jgi:hypothetical protein
LQGFNYYFGAGFGAGFFIGNNGRFFCPVTNALFFSAYYVE